MSLEKLKELVKELEKNIENGNVQLVNRMKKYLAEVSKGFSNQKLHAKGIVYGVSNDLLEEWKRKRLIAEENSLFLINGYEVIIDFETSDSAGHIPVEYPRISIYFIFFENEIKGDDKQQLEHLKVICQDAALVYIFLPGDILPEIQPSIDKLILPVFELILIPRKDGEAIALSPLLAEKIRPPYAGAIYSYSLGLLVQDAKDTLNLEIGKEEKDLKAKRQKTNQYLFEIQQNSNISSSSGLERIREEISSQINQLEHGLNQRLTECFEYPLTGFQGLIKSLSDEFTELEEMKDGRKSTLSIPEKFKEKLKTELANYIKKHGIEDISYINETYDLLKKRIEQYFAENQLPISPVSIDYVAPDRVQSRIPRIVIIQKNFQGEQKRKGGYEVMMAIRRYQMIFFGMASIFGVAGFSKIRQNGSILIPVSFFLLGFGIYSVIKNIQAEKKDFKAKQLQQAKEFITAEAKRISNDFSREWKMVITACLRAQAINFAKDLDNFLLLYSRSIGQENENKKRRLQLVIAGIESDERKLEVIRRNLPLWERNFSRTMGDLQMNYHQLKRTLKI